MFVRKMLTIDIDCQNICGDLHNEQERTTTMEMQQNTFITNQEKLLAEIINGILPKTQAVDMLVGYFYYSGSLLSH